MRDLIRLSFGYILEAPFDVAMVKFDVVGGSVPQASRVHRRRVCGEVPLPRGPKEARKWLVSGSLWLVGGGSWRRGREWRVSGL